MFSIIFITSIFFVHGTPTNYSRAAAATEPIEITDRETRVFSGTKIPVQEEEQALFRDTGDFLSMISNVNVAGGTNRTRFFQIRGVGEISQYESTPTHSITTLIDGVDVTGVLAHWPLMDVKSVSMEKRPASVHFGGQAVGGKVLTTLHRASSAGRMRATLDGRGAHGIEASDGSEHHRVALHYNSDPGYIKNSYYRSPGDSRREAYASLVSDWLSTDNWQIKSTFLWALFHNRYDVWSLQNSLETFSDHPGKDNLRLTGGSLTIERPVGLNSKLNFWTSQAVSRSVYSYDSDWGNNAYWNALPGWEAPYDYFDEFLRHRRQSQNRLSFQTGEWTFGVHVQSLGEDSDVNSFKNSIQRSAIVGSFSQESTAVHLEYVSPHGSSWAWTTSARIDEVRTRYRDHQALNEVSKETQVAADIGIDYFWSERSQARASLRRGYKNPIINIDPDTPTVDRHVGSEGAIHLELEHRYRGDGWRLEQSLFARQSSDQHVRVSQQSDPSDPGAYVYYHDNAATTRYWGYEMSGEMWLPNKSRWRWAAGVLDARFRDYTFEGQVLSGRGLAHAPKSTWSLQFVQPLMSGWQFLAQSEGKSRFYYSNNHGQKNNAYALSHLAVQWIGSNREWDIGVRNVFDKRYMTRAYYFANEPPDFPDKLYVQQGPPRTVYVNYRMRF